MRHSRRHAATSKRRRTRARHCGNGASQQSISWGRGTARRGTPRCRTGSRLPICPHIRFGESCIAGPSRYRGQSCRIGNERCTASTRRQAHGCRLSRHHCRLRRQPLRKRRRDQAPRVGLARPLPGTRRSAQRRMPEAGARRPQPHRKISATTLPMYRRRGVKRPSKTHCEVSLPITTPTGGARISHAASHKYHSAHDHWSRCIVVKHPDVAVQWEDTTEQYTSTRERE